MSAKRKNPDILAEMLKDGRLQHGNNARFKLQRIPMGIPDLDAILNGGIPRGRITVISGQYSSGKSLLLQFLMKQGLKDDLLVAYIDTEMSFDPAWWKTIGLPLDRLHVAQPRTGEEAVDIIVALAKGGVDIIALDSIAGMVPMDEQASESKQKFIGLQARLVNQLFRKLVTMPQHTSAIVFTNQLRDNIGGGPFAEDVLPGGQGQTFFSHLMLRTWREGWIKEEGKTVGYNIHILCKKSKVGTPYGECKLPFRFRGEIDLLSLLIDRAIEADLIHQAGPYYRIEMIDEQLLGKPNVIERLRKDTELQARLTAALGEVKV